MKQNKRLEEELKLREQQQRELTEGTPEYIAKQQRIQKLKIERWSQLQEDPQTIRLEREMMKAQHDLGTHLAQKGQKYLMPINYRSKLDLYSAKRNQAASDYLSHMRLHLRVE